MSVIRIHHVQITIPKGAEDTARAFYCGVLGLREVEKPDSLKGRGGLWVELGGQQVHLGIQDDVDRHGSRSHIAYEVDDIVY
jgi:catechol 2,3-dioxygenase-like lactoylglutathione lyase family enzyme